MSGSLPSYLIKQGHGQSHSGSGASDQLCDYEELRPAICVALA